ncbi:MAG: hypothetical protein K9M82_01760 [Deltaproteobacteria bacterium]|nr:hypothetical protein [Deltaproteobacteria bacterium]
MRAYLIDELSRRDISGIADFLNRNAMRSALEGVFWGRVPEDILSEQQYAHRKCRPHVFAIELGEDWIKLEFFLRSLEDMRCPCAGYATRQQRDFIIEFAHAMLTDSQKPAHPPLGTL